jgi:hypothetical protein
MHLKSMAKLHLRLSQELGTSESLRLQYCERILDISELYWELRPVNRHFLSNTYPYATLPPQALIMHSRISMVLAYMDELSRCFSNMWISSS